MAAGLCVSQSLSLPPPPPPPAAAAARGPCAVCGAEGSPCSGCRVDYYCGRQHQRQHWPRHKRGCGSLEVRQDQDQDPRLGRRLVAKKDIPAGTVVVRELPLLPLPPLVPGGAGQDGVLTMVSEAGVAAVTRDP